MSGEITSKILASQAALSLGMEDQVARAFRRSGWPANQGMYYTDLQTDKIREVDVHSYKTFARKRDQIGRPVVNFHIFSECKYLKDQHILFSPGEASEYWGVDRFWLGDPSKDGKLQECVATSLGIADRKAQAKIYTYLSDRTHPDTMALTYKLLRLDPPDVECIARGFRETNFGAVKDEDSSAIWRTAQSLRSAIEATRKRCLDGSIENISFATAVGHSPGSAKLTSDVAASLDIELVRVVYFHAAIFTHAGLWRLSDGNASKLKAARLIISNVDFDDSYVDIVSMSHAVDYITALSGYFDKEVELRLRQVRKNISKLRWHPGQLHSRLAKIVRESHRTQAGAKPKAVRS